jgi:tetratricopeptide (TPR) repeat protein
MVLQQMDPAGLLGLCRQGLDLQRAGQFEAARRCYEEILRSDPSYFDALHLLGALFVQTREPERGIPLIQKAIATNREIPIPYVSLAKAFNNVGRHREALASSERALTLKADFAEAHLARAESLLALQQYAEALASIDRALTLQPDSPDIHTARAASLHHLGRFAEALAACDRVIALNPNAGTAYFNRGIALRCLDRPEEALVSYEKAIPLGASAAEVHYNRSIALRDLNRDEEALASAQAAIDLQPGYVDALFARSVLLLRMGQFERGWEEYECRKSKWGPSRPRLDPARQWRGTPRDLRGKTLFVYHEQGLGDTVQFFRYLLPLVETGAELCISCPDALRALFVEAAPQARFIGQRALPDRFDYHCPLLSLPLAFGTNAASIPAPARYLRADTQRRARFAALLGVRTKPRIGLVWSGASSHLNDHHRSLPFAALRELFALDAEWIALHKEIRSSDALAFSDCGKVAFYGHELNDFSDTAALIDLLDIVVTVDTSVAHLAGAMGKPVWIMLPFSPDWRWLLGREDSPWYPSARLFRQERIGDWAGVIERVKRELARELPVLEADIRDASGLDPARAATPFAALQPTHAPTAARVDATQAYQALSRDIAALMEKRLFFIGAYPKSGTTWLQLMLDAHPEISCGGEGHFMNHLAPLLQRVLKKHNAYVDGKNRTVFQEFGGFPLFGDDSFQFLVTSAIALLLLQIPGARNARVVGEKTPDNLAAFPLLSTVFPTAKFIHVVRDGRDCLVSAWFHNLRINADALQRQFPTIEAFVERFAAVWAGKVAEGQRFCAARPQRGMLLRYEEMVAQPESAIGAVLRFLDADAAPAIVRQCVSAAAFESLSGRARGTEDRSSFLRQGKPGNWREHLTPACNDRFLTIAGKVMARLGYPV